LDDVGWFGCNVESITGLDQLTLLEEFELVNNLISTPTMAIDLTPNTAMRICVSTSAQNVTSFDLSGLTALTTGTIHTNPLMTSVDVTGCTALTKLWAHNTSNALNTLTGIASCSVLSDLDCGQGSLTVSEVNQIIIDMDKGIVAGTRRLDYATQVPTANPTVTETTTNDVQTAYDNLIADGYTIVGTAPA
jgi:hypothetical protein